MAAPFGFSAGDFIDAIGLAVKAVNSLKDVNGASTDYQQVTLQLNGLKRALIHLERLQPNAHNADHINAIRCMAMGCKLPLQAFLDNIEKYEKSLAAGASRRHGRSNVRKVQWGVFMEKEVTKIGGIINAHTLSIELLLGALEVDSLAGLMSLGQKTQDIVVSHGNEQDSRFKVLQQHTETQNRLLAGIPNIIVTQKDNIEKTLVQQARSSQSEFTNIQTRLNAHYQLISDIPTLADAIKDLSTARALDRNTQELLVKSAQEHRATLNVIKNRMDSHNVLLLGLSTLPSEIISLKGQVHSLDQKTTRKALEQVEHISQAKDEVLDMYRFIEKGQKRISTLLGYTPKSSILDDESIIVTPKTVNEVARCTRFMFRKLLRCIQALGMALCVILSEILRCVPQLKCALLTFRECLIRAPTLLLPDNIIFEDALGTVHSLQYAHFCHWQVFESLLQVRFKNHPSEKLVKRGSYLLRACQSKVRESTTITESSWSMICPSSAVTMHMIVSSRYDNRNFCPRTKCIGIGRTTRSSSLRCDNCGLQFEKKDPVVKFTGSPLNPNIASWMNFVPQIEVPVFDTASFHQNTQHIDPNNGYIRKSSNKGRPQRPYRSKFIRIPDLKTSGPRPILDHNSRLSPRPISPRPNEQSSVEELSEDQDAASLIDSLRRVQIKLVAGLPSQWIVPGTLCRDYITLSERGMKAEYQTPAVHRLSHFEPPSIVADYPMPPKNEIIYYEVQVLEHVLRWLPMIIGYRSVESYLEKYQVNWGIHGYDVSTGQLNQKAIQRNLDGFSLSKGDVLGCGVDTARCRAFFTRNGKIMDDEYTTIQAPLVPSVLFALPESYLSSITAIRGNFGQKPFRFDLEKFVKSLPNLWLDQWFPELLLVPASPIYQPLESRRITVHLSLRSIMKTWEICELQKHKYEILLRYTSQRPLRTLQNTMSGIEALSLSLDLERQINLRLYRFRKQINVSKVKDLKDVNLKRLIKFLFDTRSMAACT